MGFNSGFKGLIRAPTVVGASRLRVNMCVFAKRITSHTLVYGTVVIEIRYYNWAVAFMRVKHGRSH